MRSAKKKVTSKSTIDESSNDLELKNVLRKHKIVDVDLDFSNDPRIPENKFVEAYMEALKSSNPRTNHVILQCVADLKWNSFNKGLVTGLRSRTRSSKVKVTEIQDLSKPVTRKRSLTTVYNNGEQASKKSKRYVVESESSEETSSDDVCGICEDSGELVICDTCDVSYHFKCVNMRREDLPKGDWNCPRCVEDSNDAQNKLEKIKNQSSKNAKSDSKVDEDNCYHCSKSGASMSCSNCLKQFHVTCSIPPIKAHYPKWKCQYCQAEPIPYTIEKILFFKYVDVPIKNQTSGKPSENYQVKKFLVKYADMSYWELEWLDEFQMKAYSYPMFIAFNRRVDTSVSMCYEDTDTVADTSNPTIDLNSLTEADLYKTYFIYGVKPEWLQIQRVLSLQKQNNDIWYLIKWRDLSYVDCTWEDRKTKHIAELCNIKKYIKIFNSVVTEAIERPIVFENTSFKHKNYVPYTETPSFLCSNSDIKLHNYQLEGLNWIRYSCFNDTNVILADEMGLGKTIQSIAFLYSLYKEKLSCGPFLVCAPLSTLPNWEREFELWAPDFYVVTLSMSRENRDIIKQEEFYLNDCSPRVPRNSRKNIKFHVLLVSYEGIQIESSKLKPINWSVLVLDEAHRIKNKQSKLHQMLADYRFGFKLLLTGTPLQNNLEELFYLLNFLSHKDFPSADRFLEEFADLSKEKQIEKIHKLLGKCLLRRLKSDVLKEIPIKSEVIVPVDLSPLQRKYYKAILTRNYSTLVQRGISSSSILNILMELKKCCNHPYLFRLPPEEEPYNEESGMHDYDHLVASSSKLVLLDKMLCGFKKMGHRVLIFSQMTRLLDIVEEYLIHKDYKYERIDGSVPTLQRQASIDRFNSKDSQSFVFLLSTRAGGLGINLASADTVIIYDSDWNPHNDIQALSRAHRLGQLKKVMIYRFFTRNSVEERILEVAKKKMMLTHLVVHTSIGKSENLSKRELEDIVKFGTAQLFTGTDESNQLEYDDDAINKLLNREIHSATVQESGINEYFSSFKIVDVAVKQPVIRTNEDTSENINVDSVNYWSNLLKGETEQIKEAQLDEFGKGKRQRKQVKYIEYDGKDNEDHDFDSDYDAEKDTSSSSEESSQGADEERIDDNVSKPIYKKELWKYGTFTNPAPPVINSTVSTELNRKKKILNKLSIHGLPVSNIKNTFHKWEMDKEEGFTVDDFQTYFTNICSSLDYTSSKFSKHIDKFPLNDSGCQSILSKVAIIELIKAKVLQYAPHIPYMLPILVEYDLISLENIRGDYFSLIKPYIKTQVPSSETVSYMVSPPVSNEDFKNPEFVFKFNIEDYGYTDLHNVWEAEHKLICKDNIWWRYHDLWLLVGICVHGYDDLVAIFQDSRFNLLHTAFQNSKEDKLSFSRRRLDLLEQALIIEDVIRRAIEHKIVLKPESNLIKITNKITEVNLMLESGLAIAENFGNIDKEDRKILQELITYVELLCQELKGETSHLNRHIIGSSLRANQLFPPKNADRYTQKLKQPNVPETSQTIKNSSVVK